MHLMHNFLVFSFDARVSPPPCLQWPPDSDSTFASVTELVKAGEHWALLVLVAPAGVSV